MSAGVDTPPENNSSEQGERIRFRYALSPDGSIVDVTTLTRENRYEFAPYTCVGCGEELTARLGTVRAKHFKHETEGTCNLETRLHMTGKYLLFERLSRCIANRTPFVLKREVSEECNRNQDRIGEACRRVQVQEIDLTRYYSRVSLEPRVDGFRPDILLSSDDDAIPLFVEIAVTHKCEAEKIESGVRILEIELREEDDLQVIVGCELSAEDPRVTLFNFKNPIKRDLCDGTCSELVSLFDALESREARLDVLTPSEARRTLDKNEILCRENLDRRDRTKCSERRATALLKDEMREALFNGSSVRNCFNCRLHGLNWSERPPVFCRLKAKVVDWSEAADCLGYYSPFSSASEADKADVKIATDLSRHRGGGKPKLEGQYGS